MRAIPFTTSSLSPAVPMISVTALLTTTPGTRSILAR
jgi:hypothetical protein